MSTLIRVNATNDSYITRVCSDILRTKQREVEEELSNKERLALLEELSKVMSLGGADAELASA